MNLSSPLTGPAAILIGASSGIGRALAVEMSKAGYRLGLASRRLHLLESLQKELPTQSLAMRLDVHDLANVSAVMRQLAVQLGTVDLVIYNSGINHSNPSLEGSLEVDTIAVNALGFVAVANEAIALFRRQGKGHLAAVSSFAAIRGNGRSPAYSASKAMISTYIEGLRQNVSKENISFTEIRPGFIDTDMIRGMSSAFWVVTPEKAARDILGAIKRKRKRAYVPLRWAFLAFFYRVLPDFLHDRAYRRFKG